MQTVNVQCGHCGKLMAVSVEHLGSQVSCPHCHGIVEAPTNLPETVPEIRIPPPESAESVLGSADNEASDDIFGTTRKPLVELPDSPSPLSTERATEPSLTGDFHGATTAWLEGSPQARAEDEAVPEPEPRKYAARRSLLVPILLIVLIPYSIFSTALVAWLLYSRSKAGDPMEFLRDPDPKRDAPERKKSHSGERVKYDARIPSNLRIPLRKTAHIGDIEVNPLKVVHQNGDLAIHLGLRNLSADLIFNPLPESFANPNTFRPNNPYTFLDTGDGKPVWCAFVEYRRPSEAGAFPSGKLHPGEALTAILTTTPAARGQLRSVLRDNKPLLWRVQIRRGFVMVDDMPRSATAVIGVEFSARAVEGEADVSLRSGEGPNSSFFDIAPKSHCLPFS